MSTWGDAPGVVQLPDGRRVRGTAYRRPRGGVEAPDLAVYLLGSPPEPPVWEHRWVHWPDFRAPASTPDAVAALREAHRRAGEERAEIACGAGVGRTGTALAFVAVLAGVPEDYAVAWVREHYHPRAVETPGQRRWVHAAARQL